MTILLKLELIKETNIMKAVYKNVVRSKKLIRQAVLELLRDKKDINLITITDIVNKANINRGTFYNHYDNIRDVLNEVEDELMDDLSTALNKFDPNKEDSVSQFFDVLTNYFKQKEERFKMIISYVPRYVFNDLKVKILDISSKYFFGTNNVNTESSLSLIVISNGIAGTYLDYFENRSKYSLDEISASIKKIIKKLI